MKCVVCTDCRIVVSPDNLHGHVTNPKHKPKDGTKIIPNLKKDVKVYLESLDLDYRLVRRPAPRSVVPPYPWLGKPQDGWLCKLCGDYAAPAKDTLRIHINGTCKGSAHCPTSLRSINWMSLIERCSVQRFGSQSPFMTFFRVFPNVSSETAPQFVEFLSELSDSFKKGMPLYSSDPQSTAPKEFDLPPFLAKTKWPEAVSRFSLRKMVRSITVPPKDDQLYGHLRPFGKILLTSIRSTTKIPHLILNGLTAYKTRK